MQVIGELANRPKILKELQPRYGRLINLLDDELNRTKKIFEEGIHVCCKKITQCYHIIYRLLIFLQIYFNTNHRPMIDAYFPPVAGMLWWIFKLHHRIQIPMTEFNQIEDLYVLLYYAN